MIRKNFFFFLLLIKENPAVKTDTRLESYLGWCVVVVVSLPILALPLSEDALQFPELE